MEAKPGRRQEADRFLHPIQASDQTVEQMVSSQVSETAEPLQITFTAGTRAYTLSLEKTGAVGGHIRIQDGGELVADRDLTRGIIPQAGLALPPPAIPGQSVRRTWVGEKANPYQFLNLKLRPANVKVRSAPTLDRPELATG